MPSTFEETLPVSSFEDIHEYPVATATHKAVEVYEKLVVSVGLRGDACVSGLDGAPHAVISYRSSSSGRIQTMRPTW